MYGKLSLQEEYSDIYSSILELRDQSENLQQQIAEHERTGDVAGADLLRRDLNVTEAQLLEKTEERKARYVGLQHSYF